MSKVVTFGEIMVRLGAPDYLKLIQANRFDVSYAGAEANVAVSLANYGIETDYITCLPDNPVAERCIMDLRGHKVGVDHIQRSGTRMGVLYLETGSNSRPSKVYYDREGSSFATIAPGSIDWMSILKGADWFHWTGITPSLSDNAANECLNAVKCAKSLGLTVSCDINFRANLWKYGKNASEVMPKLVAWSDIILGNEEDFDKVFGIKPTGFEADRAGSFVDQMSFRSVCEQMRSLFPQSKKIGLTLRGAINANQNTWGGVLYNGSDFFTSRRYEITDIVDRVGAGDSFMGGLIFGLLYYKEDQKALDFAVAASCLKHTLKGDYNLETINEVESLVNGNSSGRVLR